LAKTGSLQEESAKRETEPVERARMRVEGRRRRVSSDSVGDGILASE